MLLITTAMLSSPTYTCAATFATEAGRRDCSTVTDPAKTVVTCTGDIWTNRRRSLSSTTTAINTNENKDSSTTTIIPPPRLQGIAATELGVSTSAIKNPAAYALPWTYVTETDQAATAWQSLQAALRQVEPNAVIDDVMVVVDNDRSTIQLPYYYLHAVVPVSNANVGGGGVAVVDDIELLLRPDDRLVLYRSACRTSVFVYPLTQPVSDGQRNRKRMERIRTVLGWANYGGGD